MPDVKKEVESLLFSSGKAMTVDELAGLIGARPRDVQKAIDALRKEYGTRDTSLAMMQVGEGWKLNVKEQYTHVASKVVADTELPKPIIMTLSVIAHKAPANQADVIKARGTNAYEHIQTLIDAGFVERKKHGRSFQIILTPKFFDYFDVEGDQSLKMIFKDIKPSEPRARKKLGDLQVVDVPPEQAGQGQAQSTIFPGQQIPGQKIGELDVVSIPVPKQAVKPQFSPDNEFLDEIDAKIGELSKRNDAHDEDEELRKPEEGAPVSEEDLDFQPRENKKTNEIFGKHGADDSKGESELEEKEDSEEEKSGEEEEEEQEKDPLKKEKNALDF